MKGHDPDGLLGPKNPLPDTVRILEPPVDKIVAEPTSDHREQAAAVVPAAAEEPSFQQPEAGFDQPADDFQGQNAF